MATSDELIQPALPPNHSLARWAANFAGGFLVVTGLATVILSIGFLSALGYGWPALITGAAIVVAGTVLDSNEPIPSLSAAMIWLLHGAWVTVSVLDAGGDPSLWLWIFRILIAGLLLTPLMRTLWQSYRGKQHLRSNRETI